MPAGRPTKYDPAMCDIVIECGRSGMTLAEMAAEIDVDRATVNDWMSKNEEFSRAVKRGLDYAQAWWEGKGRVATFDDGPFNATSFIFNMKNRFRDDWNDKTTTELSGKITTEEIGSGNRKLEALLDTLAERRREAGEPSGE